MAALGEQCGIAIENARIFEEQQVQLNYFDTIHAIGKAINSTYELDTILDMIVTRLPEVMNLKAATIRLIEEQKGTLELKAAHGLSKTYLERGPLDEELATYYLKQGEPIVIPDAKKDIHTKYHKEAELEGIGSILAVPITFRDEVIGILRLLTEEDPPLLPRRHQLRPGHRGTKRRGHPEGHRLQPAEKSLRMIL